MTGGQETNLAPLKLGQAVSDKTILVTAPGAKIKILLTESKILVTILSDTKALITPNGAEIIEGSSQNIVVKKMEFLQPNPELNEQSRQLGGTFLMRGVQPEVEFLSLKETTIRETRPAFRWKSSNQGPFLISLGQISHSGGKIAIWQNQTSLDSLPFPARQPGLEEGESYYWEITYKSAAGSKSMDSARFYVLSAAEKQMFDKELAQLEDLVNADQEDAITRDILKIELLKKYHLNDELKDFIAEMLTRHPGDEEIKKMAESF
ncbi:MAG TPA: hypothetical protein VM123_19510 [archaeon]|nr:hypothetical protein [archaeon]